MPEIYFLLQIVLDFLLLLAILFLFLRFRKIMNLPIGEVTSRLAVLEKLSEDLARYLEEERRIYERLKGALEAGVEAWEHIGKDRKGLKEQVLEAYRKGLSVGEIARRFSLSEGEVELLISLERFKEKA